jgi:hypothetical protein
MLGTLIGMHTLTRPAGRSVAVARMSRPPALSQLALLLAAGIVAVDRAPAIAAVGAARGSPPAARSGSGPEGPAGGVRPPAGPSLQRLVRVERATREDCLYAVAVFLKGNEAPRSLPEIGRLLASARVARPVDLESPDSPCTRGYASLLFLTAMGESGGLVHRIVGPSRRYAYQHLKFLRMVPEGGEGARMSGPDVMSLLALARKKAGRKTGRAAAGEPGGAR